MSEPAARSPLRQLLDIAAVEIMDDGAGGAELYISGGPRFRGPDLDQVIAEALEHQRAYLIGHPPAWRQDVPSEA